MTTQQIKSYFIAAEFEYADSASKHGVTHQDARYAALHAISVVAIDSRIKGWTSNMYIGPSQPSHNQLLEVGVTTDGAGRYRNLPRPTAHPTLCPPTDPHATLAGGSMGLTAAEQAAYNQYEADLCDGKVATIGSPIRLDGQEMSEEEFAATFRGRPTLEHTRATGQGRSPRRQVCLGTELDKAFEDYLKRTHLTASAALRQAVQQLVNA